MGGAPKRGERGRALNQGRPEIFIMPKLNLSVPHKLTQDEAKNRIVKLIADSRAKFGGQVSDLKETWDGYTEHFSFRVMGMSIEGRVDVQPSEVVIDGNLPWSAAPFKGMIEAEILKHARELLA